MPSPQQITILGGGLAGLSLGICLRQEQIPVHILEAQPYPRHRLCGEFLHGSGAQMLHRLEIPIPKHTPKHSKVAWYDDNGSICTHHMPQSVYGLSRWQLDQLLAEKFSKLGGKISFTRISPVQLQGQEGTVFAYGRKRSKSPWFGIKQHMKNLPLEADLEVHLGSNGYIGLTPVEDGSINICGLFKQTQTLQKAPKKERLPLLLQQAGLDNLSRRVQQAELKPHSICGVAGLKLGTQSSSAKTNEICLGDTGFCIAPLTGNGQSMALESAVYSAPFLSKWAYKQATWGTTCQNIQQLRKQIHQKRVSMSLLLNKAILHKTGRTLLAFAGRRKLLPLKTLSTYLS